MSAFQIYLLSICFQAVCVSALYMALVSVRSFARGMGVEIFTRERSLGALELAAERLAEAINEAEALRLKLEKFASSATTAQSNLESRPATVGDSENAVVAHEKTASSKSGFDDLSKPGIASERIREKLDLVRQLMDSGTTIDQISERTGLSQSELRFVLGILGSRNS